MAHRSKSIAPRQSETFSLAVDPPEEREEDEAAVVEVRVDWWEEVGE